MPVALNPYDPRLKAFQSNVNLTGLDLRRSTISADPGMYVADPAATFRAGQVLTLNAVGNLVLHQHPLRFREVEQGNNRQRRGV